MAYVKPGSRDDLKRIGAVIFDCDGVLIDVRDSYSRAISKTVSYIFQAISRYSLNKDLISDEVIYLFRKSGGFNDDWDTSYGILMFMLYHLPQDIRNEMAEKIVQIEPKADAFTRISSLREAMGSKGGEELDDGFIENSIESLKGFTELLDETGIKSVERNLSDTDELSGGSNFVGLLKKFLCHPGDVGDNIIATIFEEFFCGSDLFEESYSMKARSHEGSGLIENEWPILQAETLEKLALIMGGSNFGVASGSRLSAARYVLKDLLDRFQIGATVFLDDVEEAERERFQNGGVSLKKPNPFSLLKAAEAFKPESAILYVGDSMADAMTVREANEVDDRFIFAGVYEYSHPKEAVLGDFIDLGCDLILPTVNELPSVLDQVRSEKN